MTASEYVMEKCGAARLTQQQTRELLARAIEAVLHDRFAKDVRLRNGRVCDALSFALDDMVGQWPNERWMDLVGFVKANRK